MDRKRTLHIIWAGMVGSIATYWVVKTLVAGTIAKPSGAGLPAQFVILLSLATYGAAYWWFSWVAGGVAAKTTPANLPRLSPAERSQLQTRLQSALIVCLLGVETPVVYGLIHSFISEAFPHLFESLAVASVGGLVVLRATAFPTVFSLLDRLSGER